MSSFHVKDGKSFGASLLNSTSADERQESDDVVTSLDTFRQNIKLPMSPNTALTGGDLSYRGPGQKFGPPPTANDFFKSKRGHLIDQSFFESSREYDSVANIEGSQTSKQGFSNNGEFSP